MRRRLKLPDGGQKEFDIAGAATVTRALRLHYLPCLILQSARLYDLRGDIKQGKARYHWDARPLHLGEFSKEEGNVNRAIFKAAISIPHHDPFRPSWWAEQGSDTSRAHGAPQRTPAIGGMTRRDHLSGAWLLGSRSV